MTGDIIKLFVASIACVGIVSAFNALGNEMISEQATAEATALNVADAIADAKAAAVRKHKHEVVHIYDIDEEEECTIDCKPTYTR